MSNNRRASDELVRVIPIGGLGEIGKNMMLIEYVSGRETDAIIIDAGIMFPENDMLGVDYIIPDFRAVQDKFDNVRGVIITHGHEDHTGAIAHVMEHINAPVYATPLTRGLIEVKLKSAHLLDQTTLVTIQAGESVRLGAFTIEFFHVCHSIPDCVGLGITTPLGLMVHTGDFKFDHTPVDGWPTDFGKLAEFSQRGVLALFADSTNSDRAGWTPSESVIDPAFDQVFSQAKGRIIVATFASLISRIQQVANATMRHGRKIVVTGYSMVENTRMARELGYLDIPDDMLIDMNTARQLPNDEVVIMTTGSQGEPSAGLGRLSQGRHYHLEIEPLDTVVISAHPIPGNEELVSRTINKLIQRGAEVIWDPVMPVHVSGHASREELKLLINMIRPTFFVPVHGELRHLHMHAKLAMTLGIPEENIAVVENGTILEFTGESMSVGDRIPGGYVFVDGSGVGDVGPEVLRDREILGRHGFVIVSLTLDGRSNQLIGKPELISRGFVYLRESRELLNDARDAVAEVVYSNGHHSARSLRREVEKKLDRFFYKETKRRPMVFAFINEV
ncbi:MAG: ribonuclease J [Anaerolineae bacterium]